MNLSKLQSEAVKELKFRNLGCCGGDNCPNYEPIRDNDGNSTASNHDEALEQFLSDQIQKAYSNGREEAVEVIKRHRPVFFKGDLHSLLSQDEVMVVREVLRIEILEELGMAEQKPKELLTKKDPIISGV